MNNLHGLILLFVAIYFDPLNAQIYPGTKWCGAGNISTSYNDLGVLTQIDTCCRAHDHCDYIPANTVMYGVNNNNPYSLLPCECDQTFRQCLHDVTATAEILPAALLCKFYFNIVQVKCFRNAYPIDSCKTRDSKIPFYYLTDFLTSLNQLVATLTPDFISSVTSAISTSLYSYNRCLCYNVDSSQPMVNQTFDLPHCYDENCADTLIN